MCDLVLVGAGRMGQLRFPELTRVANVVSVVDGDLEAARKLTQKSSVEAHASLERAHVAHAYWITTPTASHLPLIKAIIALNNQLLTAIFVEKPVAEDSADIQSAYDLCAAVDVQLCCGFQRRFDDSYVAAAEIVQSRPIRHVRVCFGDHPRPPQSFFDSGGGCPFLDLAPHDVDYVLSCLGKDKRLLRVFATVSDDSSDAMMVLEFSGDTMASFHFSRFNAAGYDQRCEFKLCDGSIVKVENPSKNACVVETATGLLAQPLFHSFPQRFSQAFRAECESFVDFVTKADKKWKIDCADARRAQIVSSLAASSARAKKSVDVSGELTMRIVGRGEFGRWMHANVFDAERLNEKLFGAFSVNTLPDAYSPSSGLDWRADVLESSRVDAVYIASPDSEHDAQLLECLAHDKHVLCEKPILDVRTLTEAEKFVEKGLVLRLGLHRRHSPFAPNEFISESISKDPVPGGGQTFKFVLYNSCVHDVDMLVRSRKFKEIPEILKVSWSAPSSAIEIRVRWEDGSNSFVNFTKSHEKYENLCDRADLLALRPSEYVDRKWWSDHHSAYVAQAEEFVRSCTSVDVKRNLAVLNSYIVTFKTLAKIVDFYRDSSEGRTPSGRPSPGRGSKRPRRE